VTASAPAAYADRAPLPARDIVPTKHRVELSELWTTWPVSRVIGARDMKVKYKQSALGPVWLFLQPAAILGAMAIVFTGVTKVNTGGVPYILFALAGLSVWSYFQQALSTAPSVMPHNQHVVRRSPCPRIALVVGNLVAALPALSVVISVTFVGIVIDRGLPWQALALPAVLVWLLLFTGAVSLILATVAARFRDAVALIPLLIQVGVFASPVGYPLASTHGVIAVLVKINPVSGLIETMRWCLLGASPSITAIMISIGLTAALAIYSWILFGRMEVRFADYV
jgi:ABC-type polysaccharide/polyol phosphate export permease